MGEATGKHMRILLLLSGLLLCCIVFLSALPTSKGTEIIRRLSLQRNLERNGASSGELLPSDDDEKEFGNGYDFGVNRTDNDVFQGDDDAPTDDDTADFWFPQGGQSTTEGTNSTNTVSPLLPSEPIGGSTMTPLYESASPITSFAPVSSPPYSLSFKTYPPTTSILVPTLLKPPPVSPPTSAAALPLSSPIRAPTNIVAMPLSSPISPPPKGDMPPPSFVGQPTQLKPILPTIRPSSQQELLPQHPIYSPSFFSENGHTGPPSSAHPSLAPFALDGNGKETPFKGNDDIQLVTIFASVSIAVVPSERERRYQLDHYLRVITMCMDPIVNASSLFRVSSHRKLEEVLAIPNPLNSTISSLINTTREHWITAHIAYDVSVNASHVHDMAVALDETIHNAVESGELLVQLQRLAPEIRKVSIPGSEILNKSEIIIPLDVKQWDVRRWIGLGLFGSTLFFVLVLMSTAMYRRRKQDEQDHWGVKLGTDHDVNEMLNVGWDGQRIFTKEKMGYRDDDSIFLGGYQHTQTAPISSATTTS